MTKLTKKYDGEGGFVLITALMFLLILTLLGVFGMTTSTLEKQIAGNDRIAKDTFFKTDGGVQVGAQLLEENVSCPNGFKTTTTFIGGVDIDDSSLGYHEFVTDYPGGATTAAEVPTDTIRAARITIDPSQRNDIVPHTNIIAWGVTLATEGSGLESHNGNGGPGVALANSGGTIRYELYSLHKGYQNSEAKIGANWWHIVGKEGNCKY